MPPSKLLTNEALNGVYPNDLSNHEIEEIVTNIRARQTELQVEERNLRAQVRDLEKLLGTKNQRNRGRGHKKASEEPGSGTVKFIIDVNLPSQVFSFTTQNHKKLNKLLEFVKFQMRKDIVAPALGTPKLESGTIEMQETTEYKTEKQSTIIDLSDPQRGSIYNDWYKRNVRMRKRVTHEFYLKITPAVSTQGEHSQAMTDQERREKADRIIAKIRDRQAQREKIAKEEHGREETQGRKRRGGS